MTKTEAQTRSELIDIQKVMYQRLGNLPMKIRWAKKLAGIEG